MNIFCLDTDINLSAKYHCDAHVVKMILEYAQLLCTAHRIIDNNENETLYKATHKNHPCSVWVRDSSANYEYLYILFRNLCDEYTIRYGKIHATDVKLRELLKEPPKNITQGGLTALPLCMPDEYKQNDVVSSYRAYYTLEKANKMKLNYTNANKPYWLNNNYYN